MRKYLCTTCDIELVLRGKFKQHRRLNILQALWHKMKGHSVTQAWEIDTGAWENWLE